MLVPNASSSIPMQTSRSYYPYHGECLQIGTTLKEYSEVIRRRMDVEEAVAGKVNLTFAPDIASNGTWFRIPFPGTQV